MDLLKLSKSYLKSLGYDTSTKGKVMIVGHKLTVAGEQEDVVVFVPQIESGVPFAFQEGSYLLKFKQASKKYPRAQRFMLVPTYEGMSRDFRIKAKIEHNFSVCVPVHFFDVALT